MGSLLYIQLIGYTAGTLLQVCWMVVILGYRGQRNFERVFFFLCLALFLFYGGSLLALNAQIHYSTPHLAVQAFAATLLFTGLCLMPALLVHLHFEYAGTRGLLKSRNTKRILVSADRKSTRLNSSHSQISYAVFCLKKKRLVHVGWSSFSVCT